MQTGQTAPSDRKVIYGSQVLTNYASSNEDAKSMVREILWSLSDTLSSKLIHPLLHFTAILNNTSEQISARALDDLSKWLQFVREEDEINRKNYSVLTNDLVTIADRIPADPQTKSRLMNNLNERRQEWSTREYNIPNMMEDILEILRPSKKSKPDENPFATNQDVIPQKLDYSNPKKDKEMNESGYFLVQKEDIKGSSPDFSPLSHQNLSISHKKQDPPKQGENLNKQYPTAVSSDKDLKENHSMNFHQNHNSPHSFNTEANSNRHQKTDTLQDNDKKPQSKPKSISVLNLPSNILTTAPLVLPSTDHAGLVRPPAQGSNPMLAGLRDKYANQQLLKHRASCRVTRVEVAKTEGRVLYGGESFGYLQKIHGWYQDNGVIWDKPVMAIKDIGNGKVAVLLAQQATFIVMNDVYTTVHYVRGLENLAENKDWKNIRARCADDSSFMVWIKGKGNVSILNLSTFCFSELSDFFNLNSNQYNQTASPVACCVASDGRSLFGLGRIPSSISPFTFHIWKEESEVRVFKVEDIYEGPVCWTSMELSFENDYVFFAGGEQINKKAYLMAVLMSKDDQLELTKVQKWDNDTGYEGVFTMRRHVDCNVLFLGMKRHILILYWLDEQFYFLNQLSIPCDQPICDLSPGKSSLWIAANNNTIYSIHFDEKEYKDLEYNKQVNPTRKQKLEPNQYLENNETAPLMTKAERETMEKYVESNSFKLNKPLNPEDDLRADELEFFGGNFGPNTKNNPNSNNQTIKNPTNRNEQYTKHTHRHPKYERLYTSYITKTLNISSTNCRSVRYVDDSLIVAGDSISILVKSGNGSGFVADSNHVLSGRGVVEMFTVGKNSIVVLQKNFNLTMLSTDTWLEIASIKSSSPQILGILLFITRSRLFVYRCLHWL